MSEDQNKRGNKCARKSCRADGARWWNSSTKLYYCTRCARMINDRSPGLCVLHE